jgi:excisionase family DNA binding protein
VFIEEKEGRTVWKMQKYTSELLTAKEVARLLRVDDTTVRRWIKEGTLQAVSLPHVGKRQQYRVHSRTVQHILNHAETKKELEKAS